MEQGNTRQQLNKLGSVFLTNREVSAQEAVYRVLSMPLRRCSRSVVFINTDNKESRDALLLPFSQLQKLMMTMKMFIVKILLIDIQLDQNIAKTCALHSLLPVTHTTDMT